MTSFEENGLIEALMENNQGLIETLQKKSEEKRIHYPLYRGYPNGSRQYYERINKEENSEEYFPEVKISFFESLKDEIKKIQKECIKEIKEYKKIAKNIARDPYF